MKSSLIKSSFVKCAAHFVLIVSVVIFSGNIVANSQTTNTAPTQSATANVQSAVKPTVILVPDISFSIKKSAEKMRNVLQQIVNAAPENSVIGIVTVGTQSEKKIFSNRDEALSYLSKINANSSYTDLERGTDSVLAVMQETKATKPTLIVYLTDGEVSLPKELKNKADFKTILMREFSVRPDVRVMVLNVASKAMVTSGLPPNVTVVPISNWEEAEKQMKETLAIQIHQELKTAPVAETKLEEKETASLTTNAPRSSVLIWAAVLGLITATAFGWFYRIHRRKQSAKIAEEIKEPEPQNLLRPEDLLRQSNESSSGLAAVVEFYDGKAVRSEILLAEDRRIVGRAATADVKFSSLKQENSVEIKFDGKEVSAYRLHPQTYYEVDEFWLNQTKVPLNQTIFRLQNSDLLKVGDIQISVKIVESSVAQILAEKHNRAATQSFRSVAKGEPTKIAATHRLNGRKSRWN